MKKIFNLPSIGKKSSAIEILSNDSKEEKLEDELKSNFKDYTILGDYGLTIEQRLKLEQKQVRLSKLYEELDEILIQEEELVNLKYKNKKQKIDQTIINNNAIFTPIHKLNQLDNQVDPIISNGIEDDPMSFEVDGVSITNNISKLSENTLNSNVKYDLNKYKELYQLRQCVQQLSAIYENNKLDFEATTNDLISTDQILVKLKKQSIQQLIKNRKLEEKCEEVEKKYEQTLKENNLLLDKIKKLDVNITNIENQNKNLKEEIFKVERAEEVYKDKCNNMQNQIEQQMIEIEHLKEKLKMSNNKYSKLREDSEKFKNEIKLERDKFVAFVIEEYKINEKQFKVQLAEQDAFCEKLKQDLIDVCVRLKNKTTQCEQLEKLRVENEQLKYSLNELKSINTEQLNGKLHTQNKQKKQFKFQPNHLSNSIKLLQCQVERIQSELLTVNKSNDVKTSKKSQQQLIEAVEKVVLKNMQIIISQQTNEKFDNIENLLAQLKFEMIQFAIEKENLVDQGLISSIFNPQTSFNEKRQKNTVLNLIDMNNNLNNISNSESRHNFAIKNFESSQNKIVEKKMIELKKSIETYLKSYLIRILLELQEQPSPL